MATVDLSGVLDPDAIKSGVLSPSRSSAQEPVDLAGGGAAPPKTEDKSKPAPPTENAVSEYSRLIQQSGRGAVEAERANGRFNAATMEMQPPTLERPEKPKPENESWANAWGAAAMAFAAVMGRKTGTPVASALNAAAGALTGLQEGKHERTQEAFERWKIESDNALKIGDYQLKTYNAALEKYLIGRGFNTEAGKALDNETAAKVKALSTANEDTLMYDAVLSGDPNRIRAAMDEKVKWYQAMHTATGRGGAAGAEYGMFRGLVDETNATRMDNGLPPLSRREELDLWNKQQQEKKYGKGFDTPQQEQQAEQNVLDYKDPFPTAQLQRDPVYKQMANRIRANPNYDATMYKTVQSSAEDLTKGKDGARKQSYGTVIAHTNTIENLARKLPTEGDIPAFNRAVQMWAKQVGNNTAVTNFQVAKELIGGEIANAAVGATGGGQTEREHFRQLFDAAQTPEQLLGAINTVRGLVADQALSFKARWSMLPQWFQNKYFDPAVFDTYKKYAGSVHGKNADDFHAIRQQEGVAPGTSAQNPLPYHNVQQLLALPDDAAGSPWVADDKGEVQQLTPARKQWLREHIHDVSGEETEE